MKGSHKESIMDAFFNSSKLTQPLLEINDMHSCIFIVLMSYEFNTYFYMSLSFK